MEIKVVKEKSNPAFHRKEVEFEVKHHGASTPERFSVRQALASKMKAELGAVYILSLATDTGTNVTTGRSDVYQDEKYPAKLLPRHIVVRNLPAEERAKLAAQQKDKKTAAPAEKTAAKPPEKQAEKPKEEKPESTAKASDEKKPETKEKR